MSEMVIRCEKTGKLFFSEADAKQHGEDTGMSDFAQVSLEEKVWECTETKKICFNQQQVDLHKRRVPEAVTWIEKTVADLQKVWKEKQAAGASGAGEVETEEDMLLRAAGKKPKGKGAAGPVGPPTVTKESVDQLVEMGFTELRAQKALAKTSNAGLEEAINWLSEHLEDADIDDPMEVSVKTQEELGEEAAKALAGGGSSQLTAEEKKAKLDDALAKARAKKAGTTVEEEKQKERARREGGKSLTASKRELDDQQRQRDIDARKREKREFELEKQRQREMIAKEREEKIKAGLIKPVAPKPEAVAAPVAAEQVRQPPKPKTAKEAEAEAAIAAMAGGKRSFDEPPLTLQEAQEKLCVQLDTKIQPFLALFPKLADNIAKNPTDPKYRKVRLTNAKLAEGLVHVAGARQFLRAIGWELVEGEFLQLPMEADGAAQVSAIQELTAMAAKAAEQRRVDELAARKREIAEKQAKAKAEKEAIKAQMAKDRGEVLARGPAEASKAKKLPTGNHETGRVAQEE
uniref:UBA domain-containing protein n=2 Tax=Haptolina ericina TaxID=156174 RepID=A0A7S3AWU9_9EUKA